MERIIQTTNKRNLYKSSLIYKNNYASGFQMLPEIKDKILKTGTTTIGLVCKNGIVLAADRRATYDGRFVVAKMPKVLPITDRIAVTTAGLVSDIQLLVKLTKAELRLKELKVKRKPSVKEVANLFGNLVYQNIRKISPILGVASFLVGGIDANGFWLYNVDVDGSVTPYEDFVASGSGSVVAYGVLESEYKPSLSVDEGVKLAVKSIKAAMQRDTASGSGIDVFTITEEGIKHVVDQEVEQILKNTK